MAGPDPIAHRPWAELDPVGEIDAWHATHPNHQQRRDPTRTRRPTHPVPEPFAGLLLQAAAARANLVAATNPPLAGCLPVAGPANPPSDASTRRPSTTSQTAVGRATSGTP